MAPCLNALTRKQMTRFLFLRSNPPVPPQHPIVEKTFPLPTQRTSLFLPVFAALSFLCVFLFVDSSRYYPLLIPLAIIAGAFITAYPRLIIFLFITAFFFGLHLIERMDSFFIDMPHLLIPVISLGFFSYYLSLSRADSVLIQIPKSVIIILLLFLFSAIISFILSTGFHTFTQSMFSLWYLLNLIFLVLAACFFSQPWVRDLKARIILLIISLSVLEIPVIIGQIMQLKDYSVNSLRDITGTFLTHHSMLANMMTFSLGFSIHRLLDVSSLRKKIIYGIFAFAFLNLIIFSGSRSNLIGIFVAGIIVVLLRLRPKPIHFVYTLSIIMMAFLLFQFSPLHHIVSETIHSRETGTLDMSSIGRLYVWKGAFDHFQKAPLIEKFFGIGMANFRTIQLPFFMFNTRNASGAHNNFLHVLIETGICGLILFLIYFITVLVVLYKQGKYDSLALAYFFITLSLLVSGVTQETFWFQPAFGLLWLYHTSLLALIIDTHSKNQPDDVNMFIDREKRNEEKACNG